MWFETLTGFAEESPEQVRAALSLDGETLTSKANGRRMACGKLETPSLGELRARYADAAPPGGATTVREVVADVLKLHTAPENAGALFQVASQFNLLEMISPSRIPEHGVGIYEHDRTQGPMCAMACGAGTIYRNYFVDVGGQTGQTESQQLDCLADLGDALGNTNDVLWDMRNGYALATAEGLRSIAERLGEASEEERDALRARLRIGLHQRTEVTWDDTGHLVTQAYCSALPVSYSAHPARDWAPFAQLVLEAAYEATLLCAALNGDRRVFLTLLGGGAFGNSWLWIQAALKRALSCAADMGLDVAIVSYARSDLGVRKLVEEFA